jgi:hypothetical protein
MYKKKKKNEIGDFVSGQEGREEKRASTSVFFLPNILINPHFSFLF